MADEGYRFLNAPDDEEVTVTAVELRDLFFRTVRAVEMGAQRRSEGFWYMPEAHIEVGGIRSKPAGE